MTPDPGRLTAYLFTVMHIINLFDHQKPYANHILATILVAAFPLFGLPARAQQDPNLQQIAAFPDHQVTGITVAQMAESS